MASEQRDLRPRKS